MLQPCWKKLRLASKALETFKESEKCGNACGCEKQAKWNPTKDSVWGDLAGLYAGFIFSVHMAKSIYASENFQRQNCNPEIFFTVRNNPTLGKKI
jgi:hypothetical protein